MKTNFILHAFSAAFLSIFIASCGGGRYNPDPYPVDPNVPDTPVNPPQPEEPAVTLAKNSSWVIQYLGREEYTEEDGSKTDVERIHCELPSTTNYYVDIVSPGVIENSFNGSLADFLSQDADYIKQDLANGYQLSDITYKGTWDVLFDRLRSGEYVAYVFSVDSKGGLTGEYNELSFDVEEEEPTEEFKKWLGVWEIGDNNVRYNLTITSSDANYMYLVEGWETGSSITSLGRDMSDSSFETFFNRWTGSMIFFSQFIGTLTDDEGNDFDFDFRGNYYYNGQMYVLLDDTDLAEAVLDEKGTAADVYPFDVDLVLEGNKYVATFSSMQYYDLYWNNGNVSDAYIYNANVPLLPMTMTYKGEAPATKSAVTTKVPVKLHNRPLPMVKRESRVAAQPAVRKSN